MPRLAPEPVRADILHNGRCLAAAQIAQNDFRAHVAELVQIASILGVGEKERERAVASAEDVLSDLFFGLLSECEGAIEDDTHLLETRGFGL